MKLIQFLDVPTKSNVLKSVLLYPYPVLFLFLKQRIEGLSGKETQVLLLRLTCGLIIFCPKHL